MDILRAHLGLLVCGTGHAAYTSPCFTMTTSITRVEVAQNT